MILPIAVVPLPMQKLLGCKPTALQRKPVFVFWSKSIDRFSCGLERPSIALPAVLRGQNCYFAKGWFVGPAVNPQMSSVTSSLVLSGR